MRIVCRSLFLAAIALLSLAAVPFVDHSSAVFSPQPSVVTFSVSDHAFDGPDAVSAGLTASACTIAVASRTSFNCSD